MAESIDSFFFPIFQLNLVILSIRVEGFLRRIADSFLNQNQRQYNDNENRQVHPASEDPYGDPADYGQFGNVRPASEDPYGDPADYGQFGNVRPASEDPYGDPADEENRWA